MTTLSDLIGPNASPPGETAGYWERVPKFSLGGNDEVGDCVFCTAANYTDLLEAVNGTPQLVPEAEVERWYAWETGWRRDNPASDKGEVLERMLKVWRDQGNPSDPVDRLTGYCAITPGEIHQAVYSLGGVPAWCMLPIDHDIGEDGVWEFGDRALSVRAPGVEAHAILIVGSSPAGLKVVTWAEIRDVSHAWWAAYGKGQFAVRHPAWRVP